MGMHRAISDHLIDEVVELQALYTAATRDGEIDRHEHAAITTQLRLVQHAAGEVDAGIRQAVSYLRLNRLTPGVLRATARPTDDAA